MFRVIKADGLKELAIALNEIKDAKVIYVKELGAKVQALIEAPEVDFPKVSEQKLIIDDDSRAFLSEISRFGASAAKEEKLYEETGEVVKKKKPAKKKPRKKKASK